MPPLVTNLPWLNNNQDPVATYQRAQQLVQAMQAQQAQERQQQAELSQRARESAMQASFQQRSLALKEQEARSGVQVEADRLRQRGQALEFKQKMVEQENQLRARPPETVQLPGMPPGIMAGGKYYPGTRTPDVSGVGKSRPIHQDNDPSKPVIANFVWSSERGGAVVPVSKGLTPEEKKLAGETKEARSTDKRILIEDRAALNKLRSRADWIDREPAEQRTIIENLAKIQNQLDTYRKVAPRGKEIATPSPAGVRVKRKSDGKILRYHGNKVDVPTAEFDIVE